MNKHEKFIRFPIEKNIEDAVLVSQSCGNRMEFYPLCDYIIQTLFLRMTGFSEQKLKCILWEMATDDYEFRYEFLNEKDSYGECSQLKHRNKVLLKLKQCMERNGIAVCPAAIKKDILFQSMMCCKNLFSSSVFESWLPKQYNTFLDFVRKLPEYDKQFYPDMTNGEKYFLTIDNVPNDEKGRCLYVIYDHLYMERNRCAHNLRSYQDNLPHFKKLLNESYEYCENWFIWFTVLVSMDKLIVRLYDEYQNSKSSL